MDPLIPEAAFKFLADIKTGPFKKKVLEWL